MVRCWKIKIRCQQRRDTLWMPYFHEPVHDGLSHVKTSTCQDIRDLSVRRDRHVTFRVRTATRLIVKPPCGSYIITTRAVQTNSRDCARKPAAQTLPPAVPVSCRAAVTECPRTHRSLLGAAAVCSYSMVLVGSFLKRNLNC